ncbi:DUF6084 family protein [Saccharomonospora azurea]|uniref:Uncharacterized protein n=1 Tax=Saccharomonospora azurea NA-128 TaxID=882081 RepID=H8G917_9PSEU|nr:DUF6084 family protein [Saccharomonospora azurea]EHK88026.1 hypothetical protein SZMC14600_07027 [Saccharomonospora azurea SZMC 14600]EHY90498.1 hypothetical protein SacazDRAFT_03634 [Saccharomonospora azurea NA-128]
MTDTTLSTPVLSWAVTGVDVAPVEAVPALRLRLRVSCDRPVRSLTLAVSVRIAAALRDYTAEERTRLRGVFGMPEQWAASVGELVWARPVLHVAGFTGHTDVDVPVPCGQDVELASVSYLSALSDGDVPLRLHFSGTVFHDSGGGLAVTRLPWDSEVKYRLPLACWQEVRRTYFGRHRWLRVEEAVYERLHDYRVRHAYGSPQEAIEALLEQAGRT